MRILNTSKQLSLFVIIGSVGFAIDAGILTALSRIFDVNLYLSRLFSFSTASLATWLLNRSLTFRSQTRGVNIHKSEYMRYMLVQIAGALANLLVFSILIAFYPVLKSYPVLPLAVAAIIGLVINFTGTRYWVYSDKELNLG